MARESKTHDLLLALAQYMPTQLCDLVIINVHE